MLIGVSRSRLGHRELHKRAGKQLGDCEVYEEVPDDPERLISTIHRTIEKIRERGDLKKETIKYF